MLQCAENFSTTDGPKNKPQSQILFHKNDSPCDLYTMTLSRPDRIRRPNWSELSDRTRINPDLHISLNFYREAGGVMRLQHLVIHSDRSVKLAALQALANMALNTTNQKEMEVSW